MKSYTYEEILYILEERGLLVETTLGRFMDQVYEDTGVYPNWSDKAPEWIVNFCGLYN